MRNFEMEAKKLHNEMKNTAKEEISLAKQDLTVLREQLTSLKNKRGYREKFVEVKAAQQKLNKLQHQFSVDFNITRQINVNFRRKFEIGRDYKINPIPVSKLVKLGCTPEQILKINS